MLSEFRLDICTVVGLRPDLLNDVLYVFLVLFLSTGELPEGLALTCVLQTPPKWG